MKIVFGTLIFCLMTTSQLATKAQESFNRFELKPYPVVRLIDADSESLPPRALARAVKYEDREEIWVSRALRGRVSDALDHEAAHLRAWRDYGPDIETHGKEWRLTCRAYAKNASACEVER